MRSTELLFAQLTAYTVNFSTCHPKRPTSPQDFMPSEWAKNARKKERKRAKRRTRAQIADEIRNVFAMFKPVTATPESKPNAE